MGLAAAAVARSHAATYGKEFAGLVSDGSVRAWLSDAGRRARSVTLFVPVEALTFTGMNEIIQASLEVRVPVGVVPFSPAEPPWAFATRRAAECATVHRRRALLFSHYAGLSVPTRQLYAQKDWRPFLEELDIGAQTLILHTHCNGADLQIGEAILCTQVDAAHRPARAGANARCLPCHAGGPCLREGGAFDRLLGVSALRCNGLVMLTCSGFPSTDSILSYEYTLVAAMLRAGTITSAMTSVRVCSPSLELALLCKKFLERGGTIGNLVLQANLHEEVAAYLCIGDPEFRMTGDSEVSAQPTMTLGPAATSPVPAACQALSEAALISQAAPGLRESKVESRLEYVLTCAGLTSSSPAEQVVETLVGTRFEREPSQMAEFVGNGSGCLHCSLVTRSFSVLPHACSTRISFEYCEEHGVVLSQSSLEEHLPNHRRGQWLFTALGLRSMARGMLVDAELATQAARELEALAFAEHDQAPEPGLDCRIGALFATHLARGGGAMVRRQLKNISSTGPEVASALSHDCGAPLVYQEVRPLPLRVTRRLWYCPRCTLVAETSGEDVAPDFRLADGRWKVEKWHERGATGGCAMSMLFAAMGDRHAEPGPSIWVDGPLHGELTIPSVQDVPGSKFALLVLVARGEVTTLRHPVF